MMAQQSSTDVQSVPESAETEGGEASTSTRCRREDIEYRQVGVSCTPVRLQP